MKAIITGCGGRMGRLISQLIMEDNEIRLASGVERPDSPYVGKDMGDVLGKGKIGLLVEDDLKKVINMGDLVIDFTTPEASLKHLAIAVKYSKPIVIGTTGFSKDGMKEIEDMAKRVPCLLSPNMSIGINLMYILIEKSVEILGDAYDIEIFEAHHRFKKDAPSGTALKMAEIIAEKRDVSLEEVSTYGRKGIIGERPEGQLGIHALRGGDIVGDHTVIFAGMGERIEITHRAQSRENFARGAIRAAKWIVKQNPGLYSMKDVLGL